MLKIFPFSLLLMLSNSYHLLIKSHLILEPNWLNENHFFIYLLKNFNIQNFLVP